LAPVAAGLANDHALASTLAERSKNEETPMPKIDLFVHHDLDDPIHSDLPRVGEDASQWFGRRFEGLYVTAVGKAIHEGRDGTVVLSHESRPERQQGIKRYFSR
jgi:hypothetical protein